MKPAIEAHQDKVLNDIAMRENNELEKNMKSDRNYVYTERAHLMCPNMHFGIMAKIESNYDEEQLKHSIDTLQKAHPFLQSLIAEEADTGRGICRALC